jgi:molybdopterin/thiamine biosynthesis adenylyltransferase
VKNKKPFYWAGINYLLGEIYCYSPSTHSPCLRDIFHSKELLLNHEFLRYKEQNASSNSEGYSLGIMAIITGSLISNLILLDINEIDHLCQGHYLIYDGYGLELLKIPIQKKEDCPCQKYI